MTLIDKIKAIFESVTPEVAQVFKDVKTDNGVIFV